MKLEVLSGDCIDHMRNVIPPRSIHCIVSSPPYWGLRDYGIPGRLWSDGTTCVYGNEPTVAEYRPTCTCPTHIPIPATVYDPFGGSLTTAAVAHHMGRNAITSELNESYIGLGDARIAKTPKALADRRPHKKRQPKRKRHKSQRQLFESVPE